MANYSYAQLEKLWTDNGGPPEWAPTMAAIAIAESNGDPNARNASGATGLWQTIMPAQGPEFQSQYGKSNLTDPNEAAKVAIAQLTWGGGIHTGNWSADPVGAYVTNNGSKPLSVEQAQQFAANPSTAGNTSSVTSSPTSTTQSATVPATQFLPPEAGVNPRNFHGYDLSAIPDNELGNAEHAITQYLTDPNLQAQVNQRMSQDFGYQVGWAQKIPQLNGILIWASMSQDPTSAASKNLFETAVQNTEWWKTTNANQRAWAQVQSTDPAQANQALSAAQEKVLADANQIGVQLSKQELSQIAHVYAANTFVQSGSLGSQSGTAPEWLDQAIIDTITNTGRRANGSLSTNQQNFSTLPMGQSQFAQSTQGGTNPNDLYGIASQLYNKFQTVAQQYLMYNPTNEKGSLLSNQNIMDQVEEALKNYTGSGSSFGSSNLINGAVTQFTNQMKDQASRLYPSMAQAIAAGTTPQDYVAPYSQLISNTMGVSPGSINFTDPKWNWVIATPDAKTGQKTALTLDQVQQKLVTLPDWQKSNNAAQMGQDVMNGLAGAFGFGGR